MSESFSFLPAQNRFEIFPCGQQEWCCLRSDQLVCGYFVDRECAVRFARRESPGTAEIIFTENRLNPGQEGVALPRAA